MRAIALMVAMLSVSAAHAGKVGDWTYQSERSDFAATVNDSGNVFGQWCDVYDGNCI
jgi:hypothetical protein